jgi:hypothetical protein
VEETDDNPPWKAHILQRPSNGAVLDEQGELHLVENPATIENFIARSAKIAMDGAEATIRNDRSYREYAHRLEEIVWQECTESDDKWRHRCIKFVRGEWDLSRDLASSH